MRTPRLVCWDGCGVCYVCVEYVGAFVDAAPGLLGWSWCVLRLCEMRSCAWFERDDRGVECVAGRGL